MAITILNMEEAVKAANEGDGDALQAFAIELVEAIAELRSEISGGDTYTLEASDEGSTVNLTLNAENGTDTTLTLMGSGGVAVNASGTTITFSAGSDANTYVTVDSATGEIENGTTLIGYAFDFLHVRFSTSSTGASFVADPDNIAGTNSTIYIGTANTSSQTAPTQASAYTWVGYTWSASHNVYYRVNGGKQFTILTSTSTLESAVLFNDASQSPINLQFLTVTRDNIENGAINDSKLDADLVIAREVRVGPSSDQPGINGATLTGQGFIVNTAGDMFVGVHDGDRLFFDQSVGNLEFQGEVNSANFMSGWTQQFTTTRSTKQSSASFSSTDGWSWGDTATAVLATAPSSWASLQFEFILFGSGSAISTSSHVRRIMFTQGTNQALFTAANTLVNSSNYSIQIGSLISFTGTPQNTGSITVAVDELDTTTAGWRLNSNTAEFAGLSCRTINGTGIEAIGTNLGVAINPFEVLTTGVGNTLVGGGALASITTAAANTAIGLNAGNRTTTGNSNSFVGVSSGRLNTTGHSNSAVGESSFTNNTTGVQNVAIGYESLTANTTGNNNTAIGRFANGTNTTGNNTVAVGDSSVATGTDSLALGADSSATATSAIALGQGASSAVANRMVIGSTESGSGITSIQTPGITGGAGEALFVDTNGIWGVREPLDFYSASVTASSASGTATTFTIPAGRHVVTIWVAESSATTRRIYFGGTSHTFTNLVGFKTLEFANVRWFQDNTERSNVRFVVGNSTTSSLIPFLQGFGFASANEAILTGATDSTDGYLAFEISTSGNFDIATANDTGAVIQFARLPVRS